MKLARLDVFRDVWGLPRFHEEEDGNHRLPIYNKAFYKKMEDLEVILRFFALRHMDNYKYGIQGFLDLYMIRSKKFTKNDCDYLGELYTKTLTTACEIYEDKVFRIYENGKFAGNPIKGIYDGVMVALSKYISEADKLIDNKSQIIELTKKLFEEEGVSALTGRASTKVDLENRIYFFRNIFKTVVS